MFVRSELSKECIQGHDSWHEVVFRKLKQGDVCVNHAYKPQFEVLRIHGGKMWMMDLNSEAIGIVTKDNPSKLVIDPPGANGTYGTFRVYGIGWYDPQ